MVVPAAEESSDATVEGINFHDVVPARAVLTELARGFLLVHERDPRQAARFAQTFLKERTGAPPPARVVPPSHLSMIRRGVSLATREER